MIPTREQIEQEPEGEQIDSWVAEYVMGWHKGNALPQVSNRISDWLDADERFMHGIAPEGQYEDDEDFHLLHWHPSGSILWAWEVVEKMWKWSVGFQTIHWYKEGGVEEWHVAFGHADKTSVIQAETFQLAVCRAALLAAFEPTA